MDKKMKSKTANKSAFKLQNVIIYFLALTFITAFIYRRPFMLLQHQKSNAHEKQVAFNNLKSDNEVLFTEVDSIGSPSGKISEARSLGYLLPGEQIIQLKDYPSKPTAKAATGWEKFKTFFHHN